MPPKRQELTVLMPKLIAFRQNMGMWPTPSTDRKLRNQIGALRSQIQQGSLDARDEDVVRTALADAGLLDLTASNEELLAALSNDVKTAREIVSNMDGDARKEQVREYISEHGHLPVEKCADSDALRQFMNRAVSRDASLQDLVSQHPSRHELTWLQKFKMAQEHFDTYGFAPPEYGVTEVGGRWWRSQREGLEQARFARFRPLLGYSFLNESFDAGVDTCKAFCCVHDLCEYADPNLGIIRECCTHVNRKGRKCGYPLLEGSCPKHNTSAFELSYDFRMIVKDANYEDCEVEVLGNLGEQILDRPAADLAGMTAREQKQLFRQHLHTKKDDRFYDMVLKSNDDDFFGTYTVKRLRPVSKVEFLTHRKGMRIRAGISEERYAEDKLTKIAQLLSQSETDKRWNQMKGKLERYICLHGCLPDASTDEPLYLWIQQHLRSRGQLKGREEDLRDFIIQSSHSAQSAWYECLSKVQSHMEEHGSLPGEALGEWFQEQLNKNDQLFLDKRLALQAVAPNGVDLQADIHSSLYDRLTDFEDLRSILVPRVPDDELLLGRGFQPVLVEAGVPDYREHWRLDCEVACFPECVCSAAEMLRVFEIFQINSHARESWLALKQPEISCGFHTELLYQACRTCGAIRNPHKRVYDDYRIQHTLTCSSKDDENLGYFCCKDDHHSADCPFHLANYGLAGGAGSLGLGVPQAHGRCVFEGQPEGVFMSRSCASEVLLSCPSVYTLPHNAVLRPGDPLVPCLDYDRQVYRSVDGGRTWVGTSKKLVGVVQLEHKSKSVDSLGREVLVHAVRGVDKICCALRIEEIRCGDKLPDKWIDFYGRARDGSGSIVANEYPELTKELLQMHLCRHTGSWRCALQLFDECTKYTKCFLNESGKEMYDILVVLLYTYEQWAPLAQISCRFARRPPGLSHITDLVSLWDICASNLTRELMLESLLLLDVRDTVTTCQDFHDLVLRICGDGADDSTDSLSMRILKKFRLKPHAMQPQCDSNRPSSDLGQLAEQLRGISLDSGYAQELFRRSAAKKRPAVGQSSGNRRR